MRSLSHHLWRLPVYHLDQGQDLRVLSVIRIARDLSDKGTIFFLPLFLYQTGAALHSVPLLSTLGDTQRGIVVMALWYVLLRMGVLVISAPLALSMARWGYKYSFALAGFSLMAAFLSLSLAAGQPGWLIPAALFHALQVASFWIGYDTLLSKITLKTHVGEDIGTIQFLFELGALLAPAIGGVISMTLGFQALFMVGLFLAALSFVAGLFIEHDHPGLLSWQQIRQELIHPSFLHNYAASAGRYWQDALLIIWPVYVFFIVGAIDRVGFLYTLALFAALLTTFFSGIYIDHTKNKRSFVVSAAALAGLWVGRIGVSTAWGVALVDGLTKIISNFHWLFFDTMILRSGKAVSSLAYFTAREMALSITAIIFWLAVAGLFVVTHAAWQLLFIIAAIGTLISTVVSDKKWS